METIKNVHNAVLELQIELRDALSAVARTRALLALAGAPEACPEHADPADTRNPVTVVVAALNRVHPMPLRMEDIAKAAGLSHGRVHLIGEQLVALGLAESVREDTIRLVAKIPLRNRGKAAEDATP